jgi:sarcosine oxidase subunit beta
MTLDADRPGETVTAPSRDPLRRDQPVSAALPATADVVVIGGGIVGTATALALSQAGMRPVILELGDSLANLTTANASANVRAEYASRAEVALINDSLAFYQDFAHRTGLSPDEVDIDFVRQGGLFATFAPDGMRRFAALVEAQRDLGVVGAFVLSGDDARRAHPWLAPEVTAVMVRPKDGWLSGVRATGLMARASGAVVCLDTAVTDLVIQDGRLVGLRTSQGTIATERAVVAAGPFVATVVRTPLPIRLVRRHRLTLGDHPAIPQGAPLTVDLDGLAYWRPSSQGAVLAWPRDFSSGPPLSPVPVDPSFPDAILRDPNGVRRVSPFWSTVAAENPRSDWKLVAGQFDITPDNGPLIDELHDRRGVWINAGYSGQGTIASPAGARLLADLMTGARPPAQNPFRLSRFPDSGELVDVHPVSGSRRVRA